MLTLIKNGYILDPGHADGRMDILIDNGKIVAADAPEAFVPKCRAYLASKGPDIVPDRIVDARDLMVVPGLIDMHVHLREPGHEYKETVASGCRAAARGGFTAVCCMPNTDPVNDCVAVTEYVLKRAKAADSARVHPVAGISTGIQGQVLCDYDELKAAGVVALSDDGNPVINSQVMRLAMEQAKRSGLLIISHCEEASLVGNGVMNEGATARRLGLPGIPNAAESVMVMRDIALCELTGCPLHIAHLSTRQAVAAIREAKQRGLPVTAETAPHYFTLTDEAVSLYGTHAKMNPPLRSDEDRKAIRDGLADGTIDAIATDHAPHSRTEKEVVFELAANGIIGLETSLPLSLNLVRDGVLSMTALIEKMCKNPAAILGLERSLTVGACADITIIDPQQQYTVDADSFESLSRNTPFDGWDVTGKARFTMVQGKIVFDDIKENPPA